MKFPRQLPTRTRRDAWVEINLGAIEENARRIRQWVPPEVALMAIVKADAYGHGAAMVIPTLMASGVSMVGVAAMDEALQLRQVGLEVPVLVIGAIPDWAIQVAIEQDIRLTVFADHHLESIRRVFDISGIPAKVHIKVDTGMNRIGIAWREAAAFVRKCRNAPSLELEGIFSHLACAEDPVFTRTQQERFQEVLDLLETLPRYVHLANSVAALSYPTCHYNLVRLGITFYGYGGPRDLSLPDLRLIPAMALKARVVHLQEVAPGSGVSYGHSYRIPEGRQTLLATLPLGYADGIPRNLSNRLEGLLRGMRVPQVGSITMDQMMFDVSAVPDVTLGETLTLVGREGQDPITLTDWARQLGTIEYELMCALRVRLPRTYTRD